MLDSAFIIFDMFSSIFIALEDHWILLFGKDFSGILNQLDLISMI